MGGSGGGFLSGLFGGGNATTPTTPSSPLRIGAQIAQNPQPFNILSALTAHPAVFDPSHFLTQFLSSQQGITGDQGPDLPDNSPDYIQQLLGSLAGGPGHTPSQAGGASFALGPQHGLRIGQIIGAAIGAAA